MPEHEYEATEYEAKLTEFNAKVDKLAQTERDLVAEDHRDEVIRRTLVAKYDADLEARNEAGIAAYMVAAEELHNKQIARHAGLAKVRAEYDALKRERPRLPRRTWSQFFGLK